MTVIDFRSTRWGHNIFLRKLQGNRFSGLVICTPGPQVGDVMLWATQYGHAEATVEKAKSKGDPMDMYDVEAVVTKRIANPDIVSQEELDSHFGE